MNVSVRGDWSCVSSFLRFFLSVFLRLRLLTSSPQNRLLRSDTCCPLPHLLPTFFLSCFLPFLLSCFLAFFLQSCRVVLLCDELLVWFGLALLHNVAGIDVDAGEAGSFQQTDAFAGLIVDHHEAQDLKRCMLVCPNRGEVNRSHLILPPSSLLGLLDFERQVDTTLHHVDAALDTAHSTEPCFALQHRNVSP